MTRSRRRGQISVPALEAGIGAVLVLGIVSLVALGMPAPADESPQLEAYASDTATLLADPATGEPSLEEAIRSKAAFEREADALGDRADDILPDNLLFRIETPHGAVGHDPPDGVVGAETVPTEHGEVTVSVWHA